MRRNEGFSLIELLVVILIVAILAAIAIPVFLQQRDRGREAQVRAALKNAAIAVESYYLEHQSYGGLNAHPQLRTTLEGHGFVWPSWALPPGGLTIQATASTYCIQTRHAQLSSSNEWYEAAYDSEVGAPRASGCT